MTCSALKRAYRARLLAACPALLFVYIKGSKELIGARVRARHHEFMPASLLDSQFATLEEPAADEPVVTVDAGAPPEREAQAVVDALGL